MTDRLIVNVVCGNLAKHRRPRKLGELVDHRADTGEELVAALSALGRSSEADDPQPHLFLDSNWEPTQRRTDPDGSYTTSGDITDWRWSRRTEEPLYGSHCSTCGRSTWVPERVLAAWVDEQHAAAPDRRKLDLDLNSLHG